MKWTLRNVHLRRFLGGRSLARVSTALGLLASINFQARGQWPTFRALTRQLGEVRRRVAGLVPGE